VIVDNVKRHIKKPQETLNYQEVNVTKKFTILKGDVNYNNVDTNYKKIGFKWYYYEDKPHIKETDYGLFYENNKFYIDIKKWKLWQNSKIRDGKYFTFHYKFDELLAGFELGNYEGYTYLYPYLNYKNFTYYQSITGKDKKNFCAVDNHLLTHHLVYSKYKGLTTKYKKELTKKWWSLELSKIDNNIAFTPQFEYNLGKNETKYLEFYYQFSGWYQVNNVLSDCYYTEKFSDSTFVEIHPIYKKFELIGKVGYSFMGESLLYSYGFDYTNKYLKLRCLRNFSYKNSVQNYWYEECELNVGVKW